MTAIAPKWRKAIYAVVVAGLAALGVYGIVDPDQIAVWQPIVASLLGMGGAGLAVANVPRKPEVSAVDQVVRGLDSWGRG
ncbi:phage holin [Gordonia malaquae]|uniref:phage holin n=1 Tax=Gordonia malaquae TaxID=410332 RepID=UPI0030FE892F